MNVRTCNWSPYQVWNDCNRATFSRSGRSGGKDLFAGLVNCGATMSVMTGGTVRSLTCAQCGQARRVGMAGRKGGSVSIAGVQEVLLYVLKRLFSPEDIESLKYPFYYK